MPDYDVIFVGCGLGTICTIARFNKLGLKSHVFERNARSGGVWSENAYPGARVDSDAPLYQMFDKDLWSDFDFVERYPSRKELCRYFDHLDSKLHFTDQTTFNTNVIGAKWSKAEGQWTVNVDMGPAGGAQVARSARTTTCRWFIPAIGFAAKPFIPRYAGIEQYKGDIHHSARWPENGIPLEGKRLAVIGTGASGVQIIQAAGPTVSKLVVYQRTPNYCVPMRQGPIAAETNTRDKASGLFDDAFAMTFNTFAGFNFDYQSRKCFDDTPEERRAFFQSLLDQGGFRYWLNTYSDISSNQKANDEAYAFWRESVLKRIPPSVSHAKREMLAPRIPPHPFGCKRPSLEQRYYEIYGLDHVDLVDITSDPIATFTEKGIRTKSGVDHDFDVVALATGFDAVTGSLAQLNIRNDADETIADHWKEWLRTSHGIALNSFPNMFFLYGPQAPTAFSNGPTTVQAQAQFLGDLMRIILDRQITRIEATENEEEYWTDETHRFWNASLNVGVKSWYNGANIPGKKVEPLNYIGGMPRYVKELRGTLGDELKGWKVQAAA